MFQNMVYALLVFITAQIVFDIVIVCVFREMQKQNEEDSDSLFRLIKSSGQLRLDFEEMRQQYTDEVKEVLKEQARTEKAFADGVQSILGYDLSVAAKRKEGE